MLITLQLRSKIFNYLCEMKIKGFIIENDLTLYDGGFANGYVVIPKDHPLWGLDYTAEEIESLNVHGGITFSEKVDEDMINHILWGKDFEEEDLGSWLIGFDTRHSGDNLKRWPRKKVELEVINLIRQVEKLAVSL
jgi:hypothetical protein